MSLVLLVFIASTGMTLNLHFCADELRTVSLQQESNSCCQMTSNTTDSKHKNCDKKEKGHCEKSCCKESKIITKNPVKVDNSTAKKENSFVQSLVFLKSYVLSFLNFSNESADQEEKPRISLFPMLKEGLYILLGQLRN